MACCRPTSRSLRARIASSMRPISLPMRNISRCTRCICWACARRKKNILTEDFLRETTFTATEEVLRDRLRAFKEAGYNQFVVQLVPGHEDAIEDWARLFAKV